MACTELHRISGTGQVDVVVACLYVVKTFFQFVDLILSSFFQLVQKLSHFTLLIGRNVAEIVHQGRYLTFLAEIFDT